MTQEESSHPKLVANPPAVQPDAIALAELISLLAEPRAQSPVAVTEPEESASQDWQVKLRQAEVRPPTTVPTALPPQLLPPTAPPPAQAQPTPQIPYQSVAALTQELWDLRMVLLSDSDYYGQQLTKLKRQYWYLAGIATGALTVLAIFMGWTLVNLKNAQIRLAQYEDAIASNSLRLEQLDTRTIAQLEEQVTALRAEVPPTLSTDLETAQANIAQLQAQIQEMESSLKAQDQAIGVLVSAMQGLMGR